MIVVMTQYLQEFAPAAAPWLIGAAAGLFLLGLVLAVLEPGHHLYFFGTNNVLYTSLIIATRKVEMVGIDTEDGDVMVGLLEDDLPSEVSIAKIFDTNLLDKIKTGKRLPVIQINQNKEALVNDVFDITPNNAGECLFSVSDVLWRTGFSQGLVQYDSGSPSFALIGNELVLIGLHHKANSDPAYWYWADAIQTAMDDLLSGNTNSLKRFTLSNFLNL